jgi:uncharacterized protein (UPF0276 family)
MKFAINYSPQAAELLSASRIEIDYFKTPPWPEMIAIVQGYCPVAVHFDLKAGSGQKFETDFSSIENILNTTATRYVNLHLAADLRDGLPFEPDDPSPLEVQKVIENLYADVAVAVRHFGSERVILENTPYRIGEGHIVRTCVYPDVISEIITAHNCGLLLDISHARISAATLGMDTKEYILALPAQRLRELHFTGLHELEDGSLMDHLPIQETDWPWLKWVLYGISHDGWGKPHMLALEYGGGTATSSLTPTAKLM